MSSRYQCFHCGEVIEAGELHSHAPVVKDNLTGDVAALVEAANSAVQLEREYGSGPHTDLIDALSAKLTELAAEVATLTAELRDVRVELMDKRDRLEKLSQ